MAIGKQVSNTFGLLMALEVVKTITSASKLLKKPKKNGILLTATQRLTLRSCTQNSHTL
jgi:hypothetical protein